MSTRRCCLPLCLLLYCATAVRVVRIGYVGMMEDRDISSFVETARVKAGSNDVYLDMIYIDEDEDVIKFGSICDLYNKGVVAVVSGSRSESYSRRLESFAANFEVPIMFVNAQRFPKPRYSIELHPGAYYEGKLSKDLIMHFGWVTVLLLYEDKNDLIRIQHLMTISADFHRPKVTLRKIPAGQTNLVVFLKSVRNQMLARNIVVHAGLELSRDILDVISRVLNMHTSEYNYVFTHPDLLSVVSRKQFANLRCNISFLVPQKDVSKTLNSELYKDAFHLLYRALNAMPDIQERSLKCDRKGDYWPDGKSFFNTLLQTNFTGATRKVKFDAAGKRRNAKMIVYETNAGGFRKIAQWTENKRLGLLPPPKPIYSANDTSLVNKTLRVMVLLEEPFVMYKANGRNLIGNDKYEGFCIDLLNAIAEQLEFHYIIKETKDNTYGTKDDNSKWNGIVGELQRWEADLALSALTVSHSRFEVIDFTVPYMHLGISILFKRSLDNQLALFTFLRPLSLDVWLFLIASYFLVSMMMWLLARFSPYEWYNPHPKNMRVDSVKNQFNVTNSFWFSIGSLMQQGSDVSPRAPSTRIVAVIWWLFTLVIISSYTAQLAAFLTVERMSTAIVNAEDLSRYSQSRVKYGTLSAGATMNFFKESKIPTYERVWAFMSSATPSVFVNNSKEGIARVKAGDYAYFMESSMLEYYAERDCELMQIGGLLDSKGYSIALPKGSPYRAAISQAILLLQDTTVMESLKDRWWRTKERCDGVAGKNKYAKLESSMKTIGGIFLVLLGGAVVALIVALLEFVHRIRRKSPQSAQLTWLYHIWKRLAKAKKKRNTVEEEELRSSSNRADSRSQADRQHAVRRNARNIGGSVRSRSSGTSQDEDRIPLAFDAYY